MTRNFNTWTEYDDWLKTVWDKYAIYRIDEMPDGTLVIHYEETNRKNQGEQQ